MSTIKCHTPADASNGHWMDKYDFEAHQIARVTHRAEAAREANPAFAKWAQGYGPLRHDPVTQTRVLDLAITLVEQKRFPSREAVYDMLCAADRVTCAGMSLVAHMTYAKAVRLDGTPLQREEFKSKPEGHTGGSLNMVPAYVGYLAANALNGITRSWVMGQGHCVAAIDAVNLLVGNMSEAHGARYDTTQAGLSRFVNDFYSYAITPKGRPASPLGSHVNPHTGGGVLEGGYLGFAEVLYPHMPLPGESLVAFLSDGAFEEQRGSDWTPRWWRENDTGFVLPMMILNGRRIEQRTAVTQGGGRRWLRDHLRLNGFDPLTLDGTDPAAFAWAIIEMEGRLSACAHSLHEGTQRYPVPIHYGIAETVKGFGFPGAGTNRSHNLPLSGNPSADERAQREFNDGIAALRISLGDLQDAVQLLNTHEAQSRPRERDHPLARRHVESFSVPKPQLGQLATHNSPMEALDRYFVELLDANPNLRPRVGNPDELASNRMTRTLERLKHRVHQPESGVAEAVDGAVITALNEEAVAGAALGNKGGINLIVSYEAFAVKMLGALRQEIIFSRHQREIGKPAGWLGVPVLLTSHTWENGKNEQSHQDPTLAEALLGEMADTSRVLFPADAHSAVAALQSVYQSRGVIAGIVASKLEVDNVFDATTSLRLAQEGAAVVDGDPSTAKVILSATGAYQLREVRAAYARLQQHGIPAAVVYLMEPGRFRTPRDEHEARFVAGDDAVQRFYPLNTPRVFVTHTRPEPFLGALRRIDTGVNSTRALGFINRGGTLNLEGLLFANHSTWAHIVSEAALALQTEAAPFFSNEEIEALQGRGKPSAIYPSLKSE
ncbi:MAG TPA: xylulose 5-phosphate 3-epimerase [Burkholderiales bacterium]|nr:xylulose 5-phosphate 3-epimerase [Burkholderiales bacterium]